MRRLRFKDKLVLTGFTFIEMLVVLGIMAVIISIVVVKLSNTSANSRDKKRLIDLKAVQSALTLYYSDAESYPSDVTFGGSLTSADGSIIYLKEIPQDPSYPDRSYYYNRLTTTTYQVCTEVELDVNKPSSGDIHYPLPAPAADSCGQGYNCNYCLTNF